MEKWKTLFDYILDNNSCSSDKTPYTIYDFLEDDDK